MVVVLTVICAGSGLVLSYVKQATEEPREYQLLKYVKGPSIKAVLPEYDNDPIKEAITMDMGKDEKGQSVKKKIFPAKQAGKLIGIAYEAKSTGYHGDIELMVGMDPEGKLTGISIIKHTETPGLGARIIEPKFTDQFKGLSGELKLTSQGGKVDAVSGATISSKGAINAVNEAIKFFPTAIKEAS